MIEAEQIESNQEFFKSDRSQSFDSESPTANGNKLLCPPQRRANSTTTPVMTTHNALVNELKQELRRRSKYVEVVPDAGYHEDGWENNNNDDEEAGDSDDDDELARVTTSVSSPETVRNNAVSSPFSSGSSPGPQLQMVRVVRCAIIGEDAHDFLSAFHSSNESSRRTFELRRNNQQLVNVQFVGVISDENADELPRFRKGLDNVDVFLLVFKDQEQLEQNWLRPVEKINSEIPKVLAGAMSQQEGADLSTRIGGSGLYVDVTQSDEVRPVLEVVVDAVLGPCPRAKLPEVEVVTSRPCSAAQLEISVERAPSVAHSPEPVYQANLATQPEVNGNNNDKSANVSDDAKSKKSASNCCCSIS